MRTQYIKIDEYGNKFYYSDKEMTIAHREDGPAVEWASGGKRWYLYGKLHREDGPAVEWKDGCKMWYLNGIWCSEEDFNKKINPVKTINMGANSRLMNEML